MKSIACRKGLMLLDISASGDGPAKQADACARVHKALGATALVVSGAACLYVVVDEREWQVSGSIARGAT